MTTTTSKSFAKHDTNGGRGWDVRFVARSGKAIVRAGYSTRYLAELAADEIAAEYGVRAEIVAR